MSTPVRTTAAMRATRDAEVVRLRQAGTPFKTIAFACGVSVGLAWAIAKKAQRAKRVRA